MKMSVNFGYAGKFLRVNLTKSEIKDVVFKEETLRNYLGGSALGAKILYDEVDPNLNWSDPDNRIIIASGPLGGTRVGGSGTIINLGLVYLFYDVIGWNEYLAITIGFVVSVITNFIFNDIWTFNPKFGKNKSDEQLEN